MVCYFTLIYTNILLWSKLKQHTVKEFKTNLDFLRLHFFCRICSWNKGLGKIAPYLGKSAPVRVRTRDAKLVR